MGLACDVNGKLGGIWFAGLSAVTFLSATR